MKLLAPLVLSSGLVDRYDIWVNTDDAGDLAFLEALARLDDRVRLVPLPDGTEPGMGAICEFFRVAQDEDTLYIRLDDDVVWLEPGFFETLLTLPHRPSALFPGHAAHHQQRAVQHPAAELRQDRDRRASSARPAWIRSAGATPASPCSCTGCSSISSGAARPTGCTAGRARSR